MTETTKPTYRRLPGRTPWFRFGGTSSPSCSLWLGPDHLLKVERSASRETYKRFLYRDIQSLIVEQSSRRASLSTFNGVIFLLLAVLAGFLSFYSTAGAVACAILALPFLLGLVLDFALGATCNALLVTAVGTERLSSLSRLPRTLPAFQQISAEIEKTQGTVPVEQLLLRWPALSSNPPVA